MRKKLSDYAKQTLKDSIMSPDQKSDKDAHAGTIIRNHVIWSMGASYVIPLPVADVFAVSALQLDMIRQLCRVYNIDFAETQGKALVTSLTTSAMTKAGARSLIKLIPGVGTVIGGVTTAILNGASTYALGEVFRKHFGSGGTFLDFDTDRLKKMYNEKFEKGKDVARQWKQEQAEDIVPPPPPAPAPNPPTPPQAGVGAPVAPAPPQPVKPQEAEDNIRKIRELAEMRDQNIITEAEFQAMKKRIIG
ncbi:uncharacterized protein (DUF697 family) [Lewinella marina]|uniref:SHOCT domain-containing protein n=1 Tax=Neolewinella marina TaxID=438751 RepID=A0A2G0CCG8_9BACT|nr:DUF697 domain-containing protein [Neolewinella marina]NJB87655.1 uncharacterized protein (DUF697 family) [Neolewinella marina]PHK97661.1 hypothetical protein CGL56_14615 [Neolewinella marina]